MHKLHRTVVCAAAVQEHSLHIIFYIHLQSALHYAENGERCEIVVEVIDIIPHIYVIHILRPLFEQLLESDIMFCLYRAEMIVYCADKNTHIFRHTMTRQSLGCTIV